MSIIYSINGIIGTDPVFFACIYLLIIGLISGHLLFKYGIISLLVFEFGRYIFSETFLYFFTNQEYYIVTSIILILLLLSPVIYSLLNYLKFRSVTSVDNLLNSSENIQEEKTSAPVIPKLDLIHHSTKKWGWILFIIGIGCLFIPNNDELKDAYSYTINKSEAINTAKNIIKKIQKCNNDSAVDVILIVNIILSSSGYDPVADLDQSNGIDVLDIIMLINIILN